MTVYSIDSVPAETRRAVEQAIARGLPNRRIVDELGVPDVVVRLIWSVMDDAAGSDTAPTCEPVLQARQRAQARLRAREAAITLGQVEVAS